MSDHPLVTTAWLAAHLSSPDVVVIDGSWYLPAMGRDADQEFQEAHIPGAIRLDIDKVSDASSDLPHMLPEPHVFSSKIRKLGIGDGQTLVIYDGTGLFSAPRVWWMFKTMGVAEVFVLDGGFRKWQAEGRATEDGQPRTKPPRHFTARLHHAALAGFPAVKKASETGERQIIDARSATRYSGAEPEPRAGLRSGHIPGSMNVHYASVLAEDGTMKAPEDLKRVFEDAGADLTRPITTTCGSGVTAAVLTLSLTILGVKDLALYDGSWSEWGGRDDAEAAQA